MAATAELWSSVGSAGAVNPPDIGKVELVGSVVQLGATGGVIAASRQTAARRADAVAGPATQAVIRYGVTAVDGAFNPDPEELLVSLSILCRPGSGQIAARLVQVPTSSPAVYVAETTLVEFQAQKTKPIDPNLFTLQVVSGGDADVFDFESNAYYVEVVLTAPGVVTEYPPAVSVIQLSFTIPPGGGSGGGGGGGGGGTHHQPD
jgi:hypothetical protein